MHLSRPSAGTVLGGIALFVALGGTALAATGQLVNIADPSNAANVAHVDSTGKLEVGDGTGPMTVDGTVNAQLATPANYFHRTNLTLLGGGGCVAIATPPSGKSLVIREVRINVFADPTPGQSNNVGIFADTTCSTLVGDVNPATVGQTVVPFDPGFGVHAGSALSVVVNGNVQAESFVDGYAVPSGAVPAASSTVTQVGKQMQR